MILTVTRRAEATAQHDILHKIRTHNCSSSKVCKKQ
nr:MAG TPA: hypothetical protein [Caudoviricetes sp.]